MFLLLFICSGSFVFLSFFFTTVLWISYVIHSNSFPLLCWGCGLLIVTNCCCKDFLSPFATLLLRLVSFRLKNLKALQLVVLIMKIFNTYFADFYYGYGSFYYEYVMNKQFGSFAGFEYRIGIFRLTVTRWYGLDNIFPVLLLDIWVGLWFSQPKKDCMTSLFNVKHSDV